jgi:uncharacterized protein (TIGR03437 family)
MPPRIVCLVLIATGLTGQDIRAVEVASGLAAPTVITHAGDGSGRLFVAEQAGRIRILENGAVLPQPFLDIRSRVLCCNERGLLGLAFPRGFAQSGRFYVHYSNLQGDTTIAQYRVGADPNVADPSSEIILLSVDQPFVNHNGGEIAFGPDGYLYLGLGDGGSGGDPQNNAQRLNTLLGKILRVDVEGNPGALRTPPDNPFLTSPNARPEIWAFGLRNPWRFSFDRATGDLWIGDVGQNIWEEINYQPAGSTGGQNYGWRVTEGLHCFNPAVNCNMEGFTLPVHEYSHSAGACSVTGGYVYRGNAIPSLRGTYIYGDYCDGRIWGLARQGDQFVNRLLLASNFLITTFGEDEAGEVYVGSATGGGRVYRLAGPPGLSFEASQVVNAASFAPGLVAGSLATVFVQGVRDADGVSPALAIPLPTAIDGVSVTVDGIAAPILAVAQVAGAGQINFQVPYEVRGRASVAVVVRRGADASNPVNVPLAGTQPGVFVQTGGSLAIVVRNTGYSLAAELVPGEYVFLYATGLGASTNEPLTGNAAPSGPLALARGSVTVTLNGIPCEVQFAGLAPGFAGVFQINFRVPLNAQPGIQPLLLRVDNTEAPLATVVVR